MGVPLAGSLVPIGVRLCTLSRRRELRVDGVLGRSGYSRPPVLSPDGPPTRGSGHASQPSQRRCLSALVSLPLAPYCLSRSGQLGAPRPKPRSPRPPPP